MSEIIFNVYLIKFSLDYRKHEKTHIRDVSLTKTEPSKFNYATLEKFKDKLNDLSRILFEKELKPSSLWPIVGIKFEVVDSNYTHAVEYKSFVEAFGRSMGLWSTLVHQALCAMSHATISNIVGIDYLLVPDKKTSSHNISMRIFLKDSSKTSIDYATNLFPRTCPSFKSISIVNGKETGIYIKKTWNSQSSN